MSVNHIQSSYRKLSAIFILVLGLSSQPAFAHAHLMDQLPKKDTVIAQSIKSLTLNFSEAIEPNFSKVTIVGPQNNPIKTGKMSLDPVENTKIILPIEDKLMSGKYDVNWNVVAVDGHKTKGQYSFTVK